MFTGIVEGVAPIAALLREDKRVEIGIDAGRLAEGVRVGDSVALDGCCLTVVRVAGERLFFQAVPETMALTSLGRKREGDRVNVERALPAGGRLDGHIVQGHVDGTGVVRALAREGEDVRLHVACSRELAGLLVPKGSVAVDGVSLTVVDPGEEGFSVALIPHTLAATTLGERQQGDTVNLEADVLGKYVRHYLERLGR
jgi:riboflavin synthase alpha subunit